MFSNVFALHRKVFAAEMRGVFGFTPIDIPQSEADALIAFYNATGGGAWTDNTNWLVDPVVNNWHGIAVGGGHVAQINLPNNNVVGEFADTLTPLSANLAYLSLHTNSLSGTGTVTALTAVTTLALYSNSLTNIGSVAGLTNLTYMSLHTNNLGGAGIGSVAGLLKVTSFNIKNNSFNQAGVDGKLSELYTAFPTRTGVNGSVDLSGNTAPSGIDQSVCPPTTGKEIVHELTRGICNPLANVWATVTVDA